MEMIVNKDRIKIGNRIRAIREKQGYSAARIADVIGIRESSYNRIEEGKFSVGLDILSRIAEALGCEIDFVESA
ncbi:MAG: helix-turn-helix transcriptional regulator [Bacteroidales bacterium]|nr:helix-turn-helix transcriptional regulator [Bacteroidales bacterium]MDD4685145.1 helix-turn-helix transcriptional regulator [Bacteroidales bacterium]